MHNLIRFIKLNQFLLVFILVEGLSISILINNNSFQANKLANYTTQYTGKIYDYQNYLSDYLRLKKINNYLVIENAKLYSLLNSKNNSLDSKIIEKEKFNFLSAKIINNSINKRNNFITLNKGIKDGVKKGMGVVTRNGVIGIIHSVSRNYSVVISLLNKKASTGVFIKKNRHTAILTWDGFNYRNAQINDLPVHVPINKGDTITTNSYSKIFPEGINIGLISDYKKNNTNGFYSINIELIEDFNNLSHVYVIYSVNKGEQNALENQVKTDE